MRGVFTCLIVQFEEFHETIKLSDDQLSVEFEAIQRLHAFSTIK